MSKKVFYCVFAILVVWNLWSLVYSPIVWYDEVFFASITHSLISGNGLSVELDNFKPCYTYGPVYFLFTGAVTKIFGFGIFQFRIVNFLFSLFTVLILGKILDKLNVSKGLNYFIQLLLLTDALFISNSHSGRMEFVALSFVIAAYWFYLSKEKSDMVRAVAISTLLTLAVLTTPRAAVICISIAVAQFVNLIRTREWKSITMYIIIPIFLLGIWIYVVYGSLTEMIESYAESSGSGQSTAGRFMGGNWLIYKFHYPMIMLALLSLFFIIKNKKAKNIIIYFIPILLYYSLVFDTGKYGVLILPFYMIIIARGFVYIYDNCRKSYKVLCVALLAICFFINCSIFVFKAVSIIATQEQRNPQQAATWIKHNIPYGSKVAGDYPYYYAAKENGCQYRRITRDLVKDEDILKDLLVNYKPDYFILEKRNKRIKELPYFSSPFIVVQSTLESPTHENGTLDYFLKLLNAGFTSNYDGVIYKNIKE